MKVILFCQNNYAFGILEPIKEVLVASNDDFIWFIKEPIYNDFPFKSDKHTTKLSELKAYNSDVIFVPGNEVPHYLRGLKTQIFHGLAGEKKGHFRIRHYFDLYLTQGPYFTNKFNELKIIHKNFDVIETGWPKLDIYGKDKSTYASYKAELLKTHNAKKIVLYAPTFSPKLTSGPYLVNQIKQLANNHKDYIILLKFHPLMAQEWLDVYKDLAKITPNIIFQEEKNIIKFLLVADLLVSDTSSVIYEFILLDKPVITFKSISENINWENSNDYDALEMLVKTNLETDPFSKSRAYLNEQFHPYNDGKSAERMVATVRAYTKTNGVPEKRNISFFRRLKIYSIFGKS
ncbi:CDP-glycerol glycerophosphotransferase family protein [Mariniflexile litorale]|uniref:CDP-glycerol glycerophosphotransferase family protein n=1 Tax=Mariniflexile litorale TaxID=3045158 RepID=A0AAU7EGT9_9FLAO|nr:CDP-glycerol glycerophosphotransferase family protein [Mariniflexile sp. KMM 9835]MDQ8210800.1 CDP-glycerol glycerophosphotransferase family protein [Mariniflexile sp. KMM 9835]